MVQSSRRMHKLTNVLFLVILGIIFLFISACSNAIETNSTQIDSLPMKSNLVEIPVKVPDLPFPDNPDPDQCGIPMSWGTDETAWLTGYYQGELIQPTVYLYDSHLRHNIVGAAVSGTAVRIILYQQNPTLDYYLVRTMDPESPQEGWIPEPFLSFDQMQ